MKSKIYKYFLKPFPFHDSIKDNTLISISISAFLFLFLTIFHPFDLIRTISNTLFYSLISFCVLMLNFTFFPKIFPQFYNPLKWNIIRMLLLTLQLIFLIALVLWLTFDYSTFYQDTNGYSLFYFIYTTYAIALFPALFYVYVIERIYNKKHVFIAKNVMHNF